MNEQEPPLAPAALRGWRPFFLFFSAAMLLYGWTLPFQPVWLDDNILLVNNATLLASPANIPALFSSDVFMTGLGLFYRPLLNLSFMADALAGWPGFFGFHLTNIALHGLSASLLYLLLLRLGRPATTAAALCLLFLVHPSLARAVAWLPGRNDSLLFVFVLLSTLYYLRFIRLGGWAAYLGCVFFFCAALFTKETAVMLPVALCLHLALVEKKTGAPARLALAAGGAAALLLWALARAAALQPGSTPGLGAILHMLQGLPALLVMLGKTVFPVNTGAWTTLSGSSLLPDLMAAGLVAALAGLTPKKDKALLWFGLGWYILFLLPTLSATKDYGQTLYLWEHRLYLPLAGFLIALPELRPLGPKLPRLPAVAAWAALLVFLASLSFAHSFNFSGRLVFWEQAEREAPADPGVQFMLGQVYALERMPGAAEEHYLRALELAPGMAVAHNNLGWLYFKKGNAAAAEKRFLRALELDPASKEARYNLDRLRQKKRRSR